MSGHSAGLLLSALTNHLLGTCSQTGHPTQHRSASQTTALPKGLWPMPSRLVGVAGGRGPRKDNAEHIVGAQKTWKGKMHTD